MKYVYMLRIDSLDGTEVYLYSSKKKATRELKNEISIARDRGIKVNLAEYRELSAWWDGTAISVEKVSVM